MNSSGHADPTRFIMEGNSSTARNDITTLALYGHGSETILFFSMGHGKVIHFPIIIWFYKHFLCDILQQNLVC